MDKKIHGLSNLQGICHRGNVQLWRINAQGLFDDKLIVMCGAIHLPATQQIGPTFH